MTDLPEFKIGDTLPFIAVGPEDFGDAVKETARCPHCSALLPVQYAEEVMHDGTKKPSRLLGYVSCGEKSYLVAVDGKVFK